MTIGIIPNMPIGEYHRLAGVSSTGLNQAHISALRYKHFIDGGVTISDTVALEGNLIHCAICETPEYYKRYIVAPKVDKRTKDGKKEWSDFVEANPNMQYITEDQHAMAMEAAGNAVSHPLFPFRNVISAEVSIFWKDDDTGLDCRCRPDIMVRDYGLIIDVKTTDNARTFHQSVAKYGYHRQEAFYRMGLRAVGIAVSRYLFLVVEKKAPYDVIFYELDSEYVALGEIEVRNAMATVALAKRTGIYPGYPSEIVPVSMPNYYKKDLYEEDIL